MTDKLIDTSLMQEGDALTRIHTQAIRLARRGGRLRDLTPRAADFTHPESALFLEILGLDAAALDSTTVPLAIGFDDRAIAQRRRRAGVAKLAL